MSSIKQRLAVLADLKTGRSPAYDKVVAFHNLLQRHGYQPETQQIPVHYSTGYLDHPAGHSAYVHYGEIPYCLHMRNEGGKLRHAMLYHPEPLRQHLQAIHGEK